MGNMRSGWNPSRHISTTGGAVVTVPGHVLGELDAAADDRMLVIQHVVENEQRRVEVGDVREVLVPAVVVAERCQLLDLATGDHVAACQPVPDGPGPVLNAYGVDVLVEPGCSAVSEWRPVRSPDLTVRRQIDAVDATSVMPSACGVTGRLRPSRSWRVPSPSSR